MANDSTRMQELIGKHAREILKKMAPRVAAMMRRSVRNAERHEELPLCDVPESHSDSSSISDSTENLETDEDDELT